MVICLAFNLTAQKNYQPVLNTNDDFQPNSVQVDYYANCYRISGTALKTALHNLIATDSHVSYSGLWTAYGTTDLRTDQGSAKIIWDIYSDNPGGTLPYKFTYPTNQCGSYSGEGGCYNREHTWCQSWFGNQSSLTSPYSDLFNVLPTDGKVNGQRSNYNYGEVGTATWTSLNGSKLGSSSTAGYSGTVFEPINAYKGDLARGAFYVSVRYMGNTGFANSDGTTGTELNTWYANVLYKWHMKDTVSTKEINRNAAVQSIQGNRNPFIDHPEFAAEIWETAMPPQVISVQVVNKNTLVVDFSRYLDSTQLNLSNFFLSNGIGNPSAITFGVNNDISKIILSVPSLSGNASYTLTVTGQKSINAVVMNDTSVGFTTSGDVPVELISFTGKSNGKNISLSWSTATETNNDVFVVERKSENNTWTVIGQVKGAGSSSVVKNYSFTDTKVNRNGIYSYRLTQIDFDGTRNVSDAVEVNFNSVPDVFVLENNFPNPFNPSTLIKYSLPAVSSVKVTIYNAMGQQVNELVSGIQESGVHEITFNADGLSSGVYLYQLQASSVDGSKNFSTIKKMLYLK